MTSPVRQRIETPAAGGGSYDVIVAPGVLAHLGELLRDEVPANRYAIITDDTVNELHAGRACDLVRTAGLDASLYSFPAGEINKTRDTWASLCDRMSVDSHGRDSCVVAIGGGVVGDVAGFVAATYLRGVPCVQVPTTLLSMLDASIGGKTGVDTAHGKNLIGAFHQSSLVVMDPSVVWTQQRPHMAAGAAEAVKHGAILDRHYMAWITAHASRILESDTETLSTLVARSVRIKSDIVQSDPFEAGERAVLNFGHTIAHALESATHYGMSHGHAVARGMVVEARLGELLGISEAGTMDAIIDALEALGLPTRIPSNLDAAMIIRHTRSDKKARAGTTRYVLLQQIGVVARDGDAWTWAADDAVVRDAIMSLSE